MYCPKCRIDVGEMEFCEVCGAATVGEMKAARQGTAAGEIAATTAGAAPRVGTEINIKIPEFSIKNIILLGAAVVILIAAIIGFSKMKSYSTPEATAERYSQLIIAGDTDNAFKLLDIQENSFLNKDTYSKYIDSLKVKGKALKEVRPAEQANQLYSLFGQSQQQPTTTGKDAQIKYFELQIDTDIYTISLVQKGKNFGVFSGWKVVANDFTKKWQITAPKGSKVFVNGVQVEKVEKSQDNGLFGFGNMNYKPETLSYVIDGIFPGTYEITATMPGAKDYKATASAGQQQTIKFEMSDSTVQELQQVAKNFLDLAYAKADKSKFDGIISPDSTLMQQDKISVGGGYSYYGDKAEYKLDSISVVDKSSVMDDETHSKVQFQAKVNVTTDEPVSWFSSETKKVTKQQTSLYQMSFEKKGEKWLLLDPGSMGF